MRQEQLTPVFAPSAFRVGEWAVEPALDEISRNGEVIRLEPRTMKLLVRLAESPGEVISSQELLNSVWSGVIVGSASVYQAISQLRKVLGDTDPVPTYIATIPRKGYRLVAPVERREGLDARGAAPTSGQTTTAPAKRASRTYQRWGIAALLIMIIIGTATVLAVRTPQQPHIETTPIRLAPLDGRTIAVLPFVAATHDEPTQTLAPIVTDLLRTRLAAVDRLIVIADGSTQHALQTKRDISAVAQELHTRYLLRGEVASIDDRIRLDVSLVDAGTSVPVWSSKFDRPVSQIADVQDEIARHTAESLQITLDPARASTNAPVNLAAYQLYLRGRQLMSTMRAADAKRASVIFSRVTTLDPSFARGYLGYGEALLLAADLGAWNMTTELAAKAGRAFDRAIELNPALGEALAQRGRLTADPVVAEELYRRGIQLAPGRDESYIRYSSFLFSQGRRGEALALIDHARRIDPFSASLCWAKGTLLLTTHGDVAGMEQLLREALVIKPDFPPALKYLAVGRALWGGEFAEGIRLNERARAVNRDSAWGDDFAFELYLEVDDPSAAMAVLRNIRPDHRNAPAHWVTIAQYQGDTKKAAELARGKVREWLATEDQRTYARDQELWSRYWHDANALRDEAIVTGDSATALALIGRLFELSSSNSPMRNRGLVLTYAHTLILAGETRRGRELLISLLDHLDAEQTGRPAHWFAWERAAAFAMLGEDERALEELAASVEANRFIGWWYTAERDPVYSRIRNDSRFQALVVKTRKHREHQRALLEEMRRKGEVPKPG